MLSQDQQYIEMSKRREILAGLLGASIAVVVWLTVLGRDPIHSNSLQFQPFHSFLSLGNEIRDYGLRGNLFGNILLFLPMGFLYTGSFMREWKRTLLFGFCISLLIEIAQLTFQRGYFEVDDLICNTIGTGIGYLTYRLMMWITTKLNRNKIAGENK